MVGHGRLEVAKTVLEVADLAWTAIECRHHHQQHQQPQETTTSPPNEEEEKRNLKKLEALRVENQRLRTLLQQNLQLLGNISRSPSFSQNCPPDLHARLISTVSSEMFLKQLESNFTDTECEFPFKGATGANMEALEVPIYVELKEPSWWIWVSEDMVPSSFEEKSELDNENYVVISEDAVVDGVANFIAKCIVSNIRAKDMTPKQLQKAVTRALGGVNKMDRMIRIWQAGEIFLTLGSWGLALAGLYKSRAVLRHAVKGVHTASKVALKAM